MLADKETHPGGRPEARLYCFPDGKELTLTQLKQLYSEQEVAAIVKRCQRYSKGYSLKPIASKESTKTPRLPERLAHLQKFMK